MKYLVTLLIVLICSTSYAQDEVFSLDEKYEVNKAGTIYLSSGDANVTITGADRPDVQVKIYHKVVTRGWSYGGRDFKVDVEIRDGDLVIDEKSDGARISMGYTREEYTIDIIAPNTMSLDIRGDDDDYTIKNIDGKIALDIDDGDAELYNCGGNSFSFKLDDGDIKMDKAAGSLYISADDADVEIENGALTSIEASMDDGDLIIETSLIDGGEYSFRADDSDIELIITSGGGEFEIYHDDTRISSSSGFEVVFKEEDRTKLKLMSGSAHVKMRADDASIRLNRN